jgi:Tfp pilus assembly protein PilF
MPLVKLWVTLQPDASEAYELLGWAYLVQGETEVAAEQLRRALALDPDNEHAEQLLQQLSR